MTTNENPDIFREDWLACLCAHYLHTLRMGDLSNAAGLRRVLIEAGIDETDIDTIAFNAGFAPASQTVEVGPTPPAEEPDPPPVLDVPAMEAVAKVQAHSNAPLQADTFSPPDVAESGEMPEIAPQLADEPAVPRDLFSLLTDDSVISDDLSGLIDQLRPKPKPKPPKQRSLF
ncbi:MAG: hypothetical protein ACYDBJ_04070 [Aggregatilineales bacterium]